MSEFSLTSFVPVNTQAAELLTTWAEIAKEDATMSELEAIDKRREGVEEKDKELDAAFTALDPKFKQLRKLAPAQP